MPFSLADLDTWPSSAPSLAVLGHPIAHSRSPAMHNAALAELAAEDPRFSQWKYHAFDIAPDQLPEALPRFLEKGFLGLNLTVPHKVVAVPLIAEVDTHARTIGAVNTLVATPKGWWGTNTDGYGLATGIREDLGLELAGIPIVLLGAGGAARGAAVQCLHAGCSSLTVINRSAPSLNALVHQLCAPDPGAAASRDAAGDPAPAVLHDAHGLAIATLLPDGRGGIRVDAGPEGRALPEAALFINATSAGLKPADPLPFDLERAPRPLAAYDMIYNPPETRWLALARQRGLPAANGLSMLVHQGAAALSLWVGRPVPVPAMARAAGSA
ncbi:MAG: shikimate dehydrogenase [Opitutaceae bacterium]|nr:shikimate dehydrogenase [Opitutaceae bacterium]